MNARTYHWLIPAVCIFSAAATLQQLYAVFVMSLTELPGGFQSLQQGIRESTDIEALRKIALHLTDRDARAYEATRNWIFCSPAIALATSAACAALAAWALAATRKAKVSGAGR
jgi:hypothetical protein